MTAQTQTVRETTHDTAAPTHDRRHDRSRTRREHQEVVPQLSCRARTSLSGRSPDRISAPEVQHYLLHLHEQKGLTWQSCNCVRHGVRFLYRITLGLPDPHFYLPNRCQDAVHPASDPQPFDELVRLFTVTTNRKHRALLMTAWSSSCASTPSRGLRASELGRLQLSDIDSELRSHVSARSIKARAIRTATSPSRLGCSAMNFASTVPLSPASGPGTGCSPVISAAGR